MSIFGHMIRAQATSLESPQVPISSASVAELFDAGSKTTAGMSITEKKSLAMPAVWRAINLISGTIGSLPLHAYRSDGEARSRVTSGKAAALLNAPHPDMTPMELWEAVSGCLLLWGNAYLWMVRDEVTTGTSRQGPPKELWLLNPAKVRPGRTSTGRKIYMIGGGELEADDTNVLHIKGFGLDDVVGLSPIQLNRQGIALALAAEQFGAELFANGSLATGILQTDVKLKETDADALQKRWDQKRLGLNASKTIILGGGLKFERLTIPPEDAQFLETRSFQVSEVARIFGVPPHLLMDTEKSTSWGTGIEQQSISFVVNTLRPWLTRIEQRLTRVLKPEPVFARFSVEGLLRGDSAARASFYKELWSLGVFSTNDILALEERPPVEGGDVRYRPLNMGQLGTTDQTTTGVAP